uniref:ubiquitinyl hydrolase 1 n=1 Tax=Eptatretus burgeri TaxID=7764 RepID=A0A8C4Q2W2_EPTBU
MKIVALPKGGQKSIHGSAVNVPSKIDTVTSLLPRLPQDAKVVPLKLKRKLAYKGHYMHEYLRPKKLMLAPQWLKQNNPLYKNVTICQEWEQIWEQDNADLWEAMLFNEETTIHHVQSPTTSSLAIPNKFQGLRSLARSRHLDIVNVPSVGNCFFFFHAVSVSLQDAGVQSTSGSEIRNQLVQFLENYGTSQTFASFIPAITDGQTPSQQESPSRRFARYVAGLRSGEWADNVAVQAVAEMLNINIQVLNNITPDWMHDIHPRGSRSDNTITIGLIGEQHYVALQNSTTN